jgi:hypothetical protein
MSRRRFASARALIASILAGSLCLTPATAAQAVVSDEDLQEYRQDFLDQALELIRDKNYRWATTDHYKVRTDDPRLDARGTGQLLDSFRAFFDAFWKDDLELRPYDDSSFILLYYSRYKYKQLLSGPLKETAALSVGHYRPYLDIIALHTDTVGLGDLPDLLVHEAAHQLIQMKLYGLGAHPSPWVGEGLASYFGFMRRHSKKGFQAGRIGGKGTSIFRDIDPPAEGTWRLPLAAYRRDLKWGESLPLDLLIRIRNNADFYGEGSSFRYTAAWLLVHFLLHDDEGSHREGFAAYLAREIEGDGGPDTLYETLSMTPEQLQTAFEEYVRKL